MTRVPGHTVKSLRRGPGDRLPVTCCQDFSWRARRRS